MWHNKGIINPFDHPYVSMFNCNLGHQKPFRFWINPNKSTPWIFSKMINSAFSFHKVLLEPTLTSSLPNPSPTHKYTLRLDLILFCQLKNHGFCLICSPLQDKTFSFYEDLTVKPARDAKSPLHLYIVDSLSDWNTQFDSIFPLLIVKL